MNKGDTQVLGCRLILIEVDKTQPVPQAAQLLALHAAQPLAPPRERVPPPASLLRAAKAEMARVVFIPLQRTQAMGSSA